MRYLIYDENKKIDYMELYTFLEKIDKDFPVPLSKKVNLKEYTAKLSRYAYIISAENENTLVGIVAGYLDNLEDNLAYISLLGVCKEERNKGIAKHLIDLFLQSCEKKKVRGVHVYAVEKNISAMKTYRKAGFIKYSCEKELRPDDEHLIKVFR